MKMNKKTIAGALIAFAGATGISVWQPWNSETSVGGAETQNAAASGARATASNDTTAIFTGPDKFAQAAAHIARHQADTGRPYADPLKKDHGFERPYANPLKKDHIEEILQEVIVSQNDVPQTANVITEGGAVTSVGESFSGAGGGYYIGGIGGGGGWYPVVPVTPVTPTTPVAAVPEPATWAMMILGFGMVGAAMRRKVTPQPGPALDM